MHSLPGDSNLLAQDRGKTGAFRTATEFSSTPFEFGRFPDELNRVAESNCVHEPARQSGQREPRLQMPCKQLQQYN